MHLLVEEISRKLVLRVTNHSSTTNRAKLKRHATLDCHDVIILTRRTDQERTAARREQLTLVCLCPRHDEPVIGAHTGAHQAAPCLQSRNDTDDRRKVGVAQRSAVEM